jgi:hypothetical protein
MPKDTLFLENYFGTFFKRKKKVGNAVIVTTYETILKSSHRFWESSSPVHSLGRRKVGKK